MSRLQYLLLGVTVLVLLALLLLGRLLPVFPAVGLPADWKAGMASVRWGLVDTVIVGLVAAGLLVGMLLGVLRQMFLLASVYFATVLAAQYYGLAATLLELALPGGEQRAYSTVGLLLVFIFAALVMNAAAYMVYSGTRLRFLRAADHLGGGVLGVISACLLVSLLLTVAEFGLALPVLGMESVQREAMRMLQASVVVPVIHNVMPAFYETLRPWVPTGLPAPFAA